MYQIWTKSVAVTWRVNVQCWQWLSSVRSQYIVFFFWRRNCRLLNPRMPFIVAKCSDLNAAITRRLGRMRQRECRAHRRPWESCVRHFMWSMCCMLLSSSTAGQTNVCFVHFLVSTRRMRWTRSSTIPHAITRGMNEWKFRADLYYSTLVNSSRTAHPFRVEQVIKSSFQTISR